MKKLFTLLICLVYVHTQAQTTVSVGAGTTLPSSAMKTNTNMGNLTNFNLGVYVPLFEHGGATGGVISLGFNAGGEYFTGNSAYDISSYKPFNITGQSGIPPITAKGSGSPKQAGFKTEAGAQANFSFGSYTISPILNLAYINLKQKAFSVVQNTSVNGQNYEHTLYSQAESKTSGVAFVPKLVHRYKFGRDNRFSVFVETNYMFGPSVTTKSTYLMPEGSANAQGNYNINQLNFGTQTSQTKSTKLNGFGVNAGIGITLGRIGRIVGGGGKNSTDVQAVNKPARKAAKKARQTKRPANMVVAEGNGSNEPTTSGEQENAAARRRVEVLKSNKTGDPNAKEGTTKVKCDCGTDIYGKDDAACKRICQFLKDGTYAAFSKMELEQIKENYLNGIFIEENGLKIPDPKKLKLVTNASDLKGQKVAITKAGKQYAFLGDQDDLVKIISIPTARVKECTDCTTRTCNGTVYDCTCVNGFCMCVICVEVTTMSPLEERLIKADTGVTQSSSDQARRTGNGTGPKRWWKHNNNSSSGTNSCTGSGIYCFNRKSFMDAAEIRNFTPEADEILTESSVSLNKDVIVIQSIGVKGRLSPNTFSAFKAKKVAPMGNYMSMETLDLFLKQINLKSPKEGVTIKPEEQSYSVYDTTYEGKKVSIVEAVEKTKLTIAGKTYTLVIISTSGKGAGSPRQQGF